MLEPRRGKLKLKYPYDSTVQCKLRQISSVAAVWQTQKIPPGMTCDILVGGDRNLRGQSGLYEPDNVFLSSVRIGFSGYFGRELGLDCTSYVK